VSCDLYDCVSRVKGRGPQAMLTSTLSAAQWLQRVAGWRDVLASRSGARVGVYLHDSADFAAALFALWSLGSTAVLVPDNLPGTLAELAPEVDFWLGDIPGGESIKPAAGLLDWPQESLDPSLLALVIYTSGSTGVPLQVAKTLRQLAAEVAGLEAAFGPRLGAASIVATVSHQHIYGLLFRVLWPLAAGRMLVPDTAQYPEDLLALVGSALALVSSPAHLSRLPATMQRMAQDVVVVFSSGAPLALADSQKAHSLFDADIIEVLGSTETGGIAWRCQHRAQALWQPFAGVQVSLSANGCMQVESAYLPAGCVQATADRIRLAEGGFELLGRADRIVKLEGKRLSLDRMEIALASHDWIDEARLVPIVRKQAAASRQELVALIVLSDTGKQALAGCGRRAACNVLKDHLLDHFERSVLPRRWRFVPELPRNSQGKLAAAQLQALAESRPA
jgi:acyl-coenzyme A synthetase/AMP-(fatty) acid ligase